MNEMKSSFHPIISSIQKVALYETKARFYLMGSNNMQTRFRVLKIDRMEPRELSVIDDKVEYSQAEIRDLVAMIDVGNRTRVGHRLANNGVARVVSAFGIVGNAKLNHNEVAMDDVDTDIVATPQMLTESKMSFWHSIWKRDTFPRLVPAFGVLGFVRFLEGYYIILVTKRRKVGVIGHHTIYKIEDTSMIYIPNDANVRNSHPDESRYLKMFQSIDLSSNFYFSYSYDITHTLQMNMAVPENADVQPGSYGIRSNPNRRFVWNSHLLSKIESELHPDWILYVMHGFVGQSNISIFGRSVYITVIARRSNKYAGTRFLKRGANFEGDVGNEVETEQMVHDSSISSLSQGRFSSFVQMRGSIPAQWSQDISKMVPKPTISFDLSDPFAETAGEHFNQLLRRYGAPIILLNLVKKREKKKHESMLTEEFCSAVNYLNQFLPPEHQVQYVSFDMARVNKGKDATVMNRLASIAYNAICKTGVFQNQIPYFSQKSTQSVLGVPQPTGSRLQTGIIRVNCVDCLDRTNTAQFAIGKCALGFQLFSLGVLESPKLEFDSDCVRMLEELYEDHGDTLALQYGGSQLVHRIKTYRKTAPWTSQGNDIMQTLSRYYSNTFSDSEKQNTMNLFLGLFVPEENKPPIWELITDYYLHHPLALGIKKKKRVPQTQWWDTEALKCLPRALDEVSKTYSDVVSVQRSNEMVDGYHDYHRPYEFSVLSEMYAYRISHSVRDFMPHFTTNFSPFTVRIRPGRRREETLSKSGGTMKNPSLGGQSSTSSTTSSTSSSEGSDDSEDEENAHNSESQPSPSKDSSSANVTFESLFPTMKQVYGMEIEYPKKQSLQLYKRFVHIGRNSSKTEPISTLSRTVRVLFPNCAAIASSYLPKPPIALEASTQIYTRYVSRKTDGATVPSSEDLLKYQHFVNKLTALECG